MRLCLPVLVVKYCLLKTPETLLTGALPVWKFMHLVRARGRDPSVHTRFASEIKFKLVEEVPAAVVLHLEQLGVEVVAPFDGA